MTFQEIQKMLCGGTASDVNHGFPYTPEGATLLKKSGFFEGKEGPLADASTLCSDVTPYGFVDELVERDTVCFIGVDLIGERMKDPVARFMMCDHRLPDSHPPEITIMFTDYDGDHKFAKLWVETSTDRIAFLDNRAVCDSIHLFTFSEESGRTLFDQLTMLSALVKL